MISQGEGFILQSRKYSRNNAGKSLSKYLLLKRNEFAYNHGASKAKPFGVSYRLIESDEARVPYVYHAFSMQLGDLDYWSYALNTESIERQLQQIITSGVRMDGLLNISFDAYMSLSVPYPSLPEQKNIATLLSTVDSTIDLCQRKLDLLTQAKKALMQQIFSQKLRFKADDGSDFPDWEEKKLGDILQQYKEMASKDGTYPHVSLTKGGVVPKTERYNRDFLVRQQDKQYRVTHKDDICYNPANLKFGVICRNKYGDGIFSPIYITYRVSEGNIPQFVEALVTRDDFIGRALRFQEGTVYERMAVSPEDFEKMKVQLPSLPEQQKIASCLSSADALIDQARTELEQWQEVKKSLLQQMFV